MTAILTQMELTRFSWSHFEARFKTKKLRSIATFLHHYYEYGKQYQGRLIILDNSLKKKPILLIISFHLITRLTQSWVACIVRPYHQFKSIGHREPESEPLQFDRCFFILYPLAPLLYLYSNLNPEFAPSKLS